MNAQAEPKQDSEVKSNFSVLAAINVNGHTEKKGKFTYLSWTFAVSELLKQDPLATGHIVTGKQIGRAHV